MTRWRWPGLSQSAFDEVQLAAVALWASIGSQVLAPHARFNHRQSHRRIASDALRALALFVEHTLPLCWAGARHSLSPIEADTGDDGPSMLSLVSRGVVNFAHSPELFDRVTKASSASSVATCGLQIAGPQTKFQLRSCGNAA
jgi:hypothetical protein